MKNLVLSAILTCGYSISHAQTYAQKDELIPENYEVYNQLTTLKRKAFNDSWKGSLRLLSACEWDGPIINSDVKNSVAEYKEISESNLLGALENNKKEGCKFVNISVEHFQYYFCINLKYLCED